MKNEPSPFSIANIRLFLAFRVFFNARFYYPVFTILFLDYGLSLEQFALLNTVWAITIVCAEVPSGALADLIGRRRLLVLTSQLMIVELAVIAFIPLGNMTLVFWAFLINRMLSGLAEAMASGADEAIAYDSLVNHGNPEHWPRVLSLQMRLNAGASAVAMTVGALVYDPEAINRLLRLLGTDFSLGQQITMRFPVYLTLVLALLAFRTTLAMQEVRTGDRHREPPSLDTLWQAGAVTWRAGLWILHTPFALAVILFGMYYDHLLRLMITLTSQYFREIQLPEASFGAIMAILSLLGLLVPKAAEKLVAQFSPVQNGLLMILLTLLALWGLTGFFPYLGIVPMALVLAGLQLTSFFTSHYLNRIASSEQRATVLSFKGLAFNLAYGIIGVVFAGLMQLQRRQIQADNREWSAESIESGAFRATIDWFPAYGLILAAIITVLCVWLLRPTAEHRQPF